MEKLKQIFNSNKGFARMKELKGEGIQTRDIAKAVEADIIEKMKPGLYKLIDYKWDEYESFASICMAEKNAVICLISAAAYYELTTENPSKIYVAVPMNTPRFRLSYPPVNLYYFSKKRYQIGIENIETNSGVVRIYTPEATIADLFRYINKLGEEVALESLKTYLKRSDRKINKLAKVAEQIGVYKKMEAYIKGAM